MPSLKNGHLIRLKLNEKGTGITGDTVCYFKAQVRYRDVAISPDGKTIYAVTDSASVTSGPSAEDPKQVSYKGCLLAFHYEGNNTADNSSNSPVNKKENTDDKAVNKKIPVCQTEVSTLSCPNVNQNPMNTVTAIVETPKGSGYKYINEPDLKLFKLKKTMPAGMVFPFDFGFIPGTKGEDGDPLDIIILSELSSFPGCIMDCRLIGAIAAEQTEEGYTVRNDRFLAVPEVSQLFAHIQSIDDLPPKMIEQLETFFVNYNELAGKTFKPLERKSAEEAYQLIAGQHDK